MRVVTIVTVVHGNRGCKLNPGTTKEPAHGQVDGCALNSARTIWWCVQHLLLPLLRPCAALSIPRGRSFGCHVGGARLPQTPLGSPTSLRMPGPSPPVRVVTASVTRTSGSSRRWRRRSRGVAVLPADASTGRGRSAAYLAPTIMDVASSGGRVVVGCRLDGDLGTPGPANCGRHCADAGGGR